MARLGLFVAGGGCGAVVVALVVLLFAAGWLEGRWNRW